MPLRESTMTEPTLDTLTRCWPRILLITFLCLLAVAPSASAEWAGVWQ